MNSVITIFYMLLVLLIGCAFFYFVAFLKILSEISTQKINEDE